MEDKSKFNLDEDLKDVIGGEMEPEEFDWRVKDYITPVKHETPGADWFFSKIEGIKNIFRRKNNMTENEKLLDDDLNNNAGGNQ